MAFAGEHDEDGAERDDGVLAQVLEQVLSVLSFTEMELAKDQVEGPLPQLPDRCARAHGKLDGLHTGQREHVAHLAAHARLRLDDQRRYACCSGQHRGSGERR